MNEVFFLKYPANPPKLSYILADLAALLPLANQNGMAGQLRSLWGEGERETEVRAKLGARENANLNGKEQKVIVESTFEQDIVSRLFPSFFPRHFDVHFKSLSVE